METLLTQDSMQQTEQAQEIAGKKRIVKGIAGVSETGSKYEQGAKCSRNYWQQII
jgi:hypothetical protein